MAVEIYGGRGSSGRGKEKKEKVTNTETWRGTTAVVGLRERGRKKKEGKLRLGKNGIEEEK